MKDNRNLNSKGITLQFPLDQFETLREAAHLLRRTKTSLIREGVALIIHRHFERLNEDATNKETL